MTSTSRVGLWLQLPAASACWGHLFKQLCTQTLWRSSFLQKGCRFVVQRRTCVGWRGLKEEVVTPKDDLCKSKIDLWAHVLCWTAQKDKKKKMGSSQAWQHLHALSCGRLFCWTAENRWKTLTINFWFYPYLATQNSCFSEPHLLLKHIIVFFPLLFYQTIGVKCQRLWQRLLSCIVVVAQVEEEWEADRPYQKVRLNNPAVLECCYSGNNSMTVSWVKFVVLDPTVSHQHVNSSSLVTQSKKKDGSWCNTLSLSSAQLNDSGLYQCYLKKQSKIGTLSHGTFLHVYSKCSEYLAWLS